MAGTMIKAVISIVPPWKSSGLVLSGDAKASTHHSILRSRITDKMLLHFVA